MEVAINSPSITGKTTKKMPLCPKCKVELGYRVSRGFLFKRLLNWLPVKRFYCYKCRKKHYVWINY